MILSIKRALLLAVFLTLFAAPLVFADSNVSESAIQKLISETKAVSDGVSVADPN